MAASARYFDLVREMKNPYNHRLRLVESARQRGIKPTAHLFATTAALSTADFIATRNNLQNGGRELNPVSRVFAGSTAGLAVNFAGETVGVIAVSYLFHRSGHHKLERAVTILNIGASATAVSFDLLHH